MKGLMRIRSIEKRYFLLGIFLVFAALLSAQKICHKIENSDNNTFSSVLTEEVIVSDAIKQDSVSGSRTLALKTNLLYFATLIPNIGIELFFNDKWSVSANWMYAWWKNDRKHWYWRVYGGDLEGRWWFGEKGFGDDFTGHHIGLYVQAGTFDFEVGNKGQMVDEWSFGGGLSYGYSISLTKCLNMDFSLGLGYFRADFKEYLPMDGHYVWQQTTRRNWIGPTKAEVSLVWIIGGNEKR